MGLLVDDASVKKSAASSLFESNAAAAAPAAPRKRKASNEGKSSLVDPECDEKEALPTVPGDHKRVGQKPKKRRQEHEEEDPDRLSRTVFVASS